MFIKLSLKAKLNVTKMCKHVYITNTSAHHVRLSLQKRSLDVNKAVKKIHLKTILKTYMLHLNKTKGPPRAPPALLIV